MPKTTPKDPKTLMHRLIIRSRHKSQEPSVMPTQNTTPLSPFLMALCPSPAARTHSCMCQATSPTMCCEVANTWLA